MSKFDAALEVLKEGGNKGFLPYGTTPDFIQERFDSCQLARRILQAAAKVDKERALALAQEVPCDMDYGVYGLLFALPDDDGTPGEEGGGK